MKKEEKMLLKELCSFKSVNIEEELLAYATAPVLGYLFFNRMQGVAYGKLKECGLLGKVNREFRNSIKSAYDQNIEKNRSFFACVERLRDILSVCNFKYAMLKGAYLCRYYPEGYRTSNDIDLLVLPENVTAVGRLLGQAGFQQGSIRNGEFIAATRREIIESKMTRGETVPYILEVNLPGMRFLEVDINFSLDYQNGDPAVLEKILDRVCDRAVGDFHVQSLDCYDFFIHLCCHLYKEATTLPWIEMKRDMTLYKYCDIYMLLSEMTDSETEKMFQRAKEIHVHKVCASAILQTAALFDWNNGRVVAMAQEVLEEDKDFIDKVFSPKEKKTYLYTEKDVSKRFFSEDRKGLLEEVLAS